MGTGALRRGAGTGTMGLVGVGVEDPHDVVVGRVVALVRVPPLYLPKELG